MSSAVGIGYVFTPAPGLVGVQRLTYTAPSNTTCNPTATLRLRVVAAPVISVVSPTQTSVCLTNGPVVLTGSPAGGIFSGPGVRGGNTFDPQLVGRGMYQLTYTYQDLVERWISCPSTITFTLSVLPPSTVQLPPDTVLCPGSTQPFRLRAMPAGGTWTGEGVSGSPATRFVFSPPANLAGRQVALTYTLPVLSCAIARPYRITGATTPLFSSFWEPVTCPENQVVPLRLRFSTASSLDNSTAGTVTWDFGDGTPPANTTTFEAVEHTYAQVGTYQPQAILHYLNGRCQKQTTPAPVTVKAAFYPNIITPNGDKQNATFAPVIPCAMRLRVFSRWGQQVYESASYANDWSGEGLPAGTYYYLLDSPSGQKIKGWLEVVK